MKLRSMSIKADFYLLCSATDSYDIALSALNVDIAHSVFDGTPIDSDYQTKLDFNNTFAFENFQLYPDPMIYEYSTIDTPPNYKPVARGAEEDYFTLFEFSEMGSRANYVNTKSCCCCQRVYRTNYCL